jgi:hypothetical protein
VCLCVDVRSRASADELLQVKRFALIGGLWTGAELCFAKFLKSMYLRAL